MSILQTTLALEIAAGQTIVLIPAQSSLPATWEQSFSTFFDNQPAIDLHLLTEQDGSSQSLGRWQISGFPLGRRGAIEVQVKVSVDPQGTVGLTADRGAQALKVTCLSGTPAKLPVRASSSRLLNGSNAASRSNRHKPVAGDLGQLDSEKRDFLRKRGFEISRDGRLVQGAKRTKKGLFGRQVSIFDELSPQEIIDLIGEPLAPEESQRCPNPRCGATIPRQAKRCEWCGEKLSD